MRHKHLCATGHFACPSGCHECCHICPSRLHLGHAGCRPKERCPGAWHASSGTLRGCCLGPTAGEPLSSAWSPRSWGLAAASLHVARNLTRCKTSSIAAQASRCSGHGAVQTCHGAALGLEPRCRGRRTCKHCMPPRLGGLCSVPVSGALWHACMHVISNQLLCSIQPARQHTCRRCRSPRLAGLCGVPGAGAVRG